MKVFQSILTASALLALVACGGGGSSTPAAAPVAGDPASGSSLAGDPASATPEAIASRLSTCPNSTGVENGVNDHVCLIGTYVGKTAQGVACQMVIAANGDAAFTVGSTQYVVQNTSTQQTYYVSDPASTDPAVWAAMDQSVEVSIGGDRQTDGRLLIVAIGGPVDANGDFVSAQNACYINS